MEISEGRRGLAHPHRLASRLALGHPFDSTLTAVAADKEALPQDGSGAHHTDPVGHARLVGQLPSFGKAGNDPVPVPKSNTCLPVRKVVTRPQDFLTLLAISAISAPLYSPLKPETEN